MTEIKVKPSEAIGAVGVAVDFIDNLGYPIYKIAYSLEGEEPVHASTENPFPVSIYDAGGTPIGTGINPLISESPTTLEVLSGILNELRINNFHLASITGIEITSDELDSI